MKKFLVIDNYDSFTYNLVHYIEKLTGIHPDVFRNDALGLEEVGRYDNILLSPGPGIPVEAGICLDLIRRYAPEKNILGVCLGHQAIGEAFGGKITNLSKVYHGLSTPIKLIRNDDPLFKGIPPVFQGGRYHSWVVDRNTLPSDLIITCEDENGMIMAMRHRQYNVHGVQFHPESVLTEHGFAIMKNWIEI